MKFLVSFFVTLYVSLVLAKDYTNYKVYDVTPTRDQLGYLLDWESQAGVDFWSNGGANDPSQIMVSPEIKDSFLEFLDQNKIQYNIRFEDVEVVLSRDKEARLKSRSKRSVSAANVPDFHFYWSFHEMEAYTKELEAQYPHLVTREIIGQSIEGRDLIGLRISTEPAADFGIRKPIIFIDAGVHAREWVGPHAVLYLINQLVTNETVREELLEKVDWVFVPNANPDGYEYSQNNDRLWRKNRRFVNESCTGVDLNRNFAYYWAYTPNSCNSQIHSGTHALSEPEIAALTHYMEHFKYNLRLYLSTHSYGNYVLWPFGFAFNTYVRNWNEHQELGDKFAEAIRNVRGTNYRVGNSADLLYTANGASDDHAIAYANANLAFTLELPGGGSYGFDYPEANVYELSQETFMGYREFGLYIGQNYYYN